MHQRRDNTVRVELEIFGCEVVTGCKVQLAAVPLDALLGQANPHLLAARRMTRMIKLERHGMILPTN